MKKVLIVLLTLVLTFALVACGGSKDGKLESIKSAGKIIVYTDPNFPPFEYMGDKDIEGVDVEIAKAIGEKLGVEVEFKSSDFDSIIMAIKGGKGDIAISGITITDDRKKSVDFSDPYINSVQYLIITEDSPLTTVESLKDQKIGVAAGYTGSLIIDEEIAEGVLKGTNASFTEYPSAMEATLDLVNGKVGCVVMDEYVAKNLVEKNQGLKAIEMTYDNGDAMAEEYGVVVAKGNEDLVKEINEVIKQIKDDGKIEEWILQYGMK